MSIRHGQGRPKARRRGARRTQWARVKVANNGDDALAAVASFGPDLILLDVMMPRMSGYDLCQKIRENAAWQGIRIVMLSAKGREVEVTKGMAVGADAYVTKPFSTKDLIAKVRELLGE